MLVNFFSSAELTAFADISFTYRKSTAYEEGFKARFSGNIARQGLALLDEDTLLRHISWRPLRIVGRFVSLLLLVKYWIVLWNTIILWKAFGSVGEINILHINNGGYPAAYSAYSAIFAAKLRGVKKIVYVVNNLAQPYTLLRMFDYPLDKLAVKWVNRFITGSHFAGIRLKNILGLSDGQHSSIHNGVALREVTETREEVCIRNNLPKDKVLLGVVALLEERKGHIVLLKALDILNGKQSELSFHLVIEGRGPTGVELKKFVDQQKLVELVTFIDREDNIMNLISAMDIIILPSISDEDFPNVVIEAMGLSKLVIASRLCGTPEQIDHELNGFLVEPKNVNALADCLFIAIEQTVLRKKMGRTARKKFIDNFENDISVTRYIEIYRDLLGV